MKGPKAPRWGWVLLGLTLLAGIALACGSPHTDRTRRVTPGVWAGAPAANPPLLNDNNWKALNTGDAIRTDSNGQAQLELVDCSGSLYVFTDSAIQVATCLKAEQASGLATCAEQGTGWFNIDCTSRFTVDTLAGRVTIAGTAFSVTYLPERQLLLVIAFSGRVDVQPVLDFGRGELAPQAIPVEAGHFFYTLPGPQSPELRSVPARTSLPLWQLPPLVDELGIRGWMDDIQLQAKQERVLPVEWPFRSGLETISVVLLGRGGVLESVKVQEAVLEAMDKDPMLAAVFPGREVILVSAVGGEAIDARTVGYDPEMAVRLLTAADYPRGFGAQFVFPDGDKELADLAQLMADYLAKAGIRVKLIAVPGSELRAAVATGFRSGEPVLGLERR